ncbi:MAG TPA: EamA family transporter, partial [Aggregatilineales bacterium]|nr:EamA family transporter [Aggregatilineales bacterium]
ARSWTGWAYLVTFGSLLGYTAFVWLLSHAPLSLVTTYAYVNPVVAVFLGWALAGEELTPLTLVAAAVIIAGVVITTTYRAQPRVAAEQQSTV